MMMVKSLKQLNPIKESSINFPENSLERLYLNIDLKKIFKSHVKLLESLRSEKFFFKDVIYFDGYMSEIDRILEKQCKHNLQSLLENVLTGEIKGWVVSNGSNLERYLWLG